MFTPQLYEQLQSEFATAFKTSLTSTSSTLIKYGIIILGAACPVDFGKGDEKFSSSRFSNGQL